MFLSLLRVFSVLVLSATLLGCTSRIIKNVDTTGLRKGGKEHLNVSCIGECKKTGIGFQKITMISNGKREIFGKKPGYRKFYGLQSNRHWIIPPYYTEINVWRTDFAFVKRLGERTYRKFDLDSKSETKTDYTEMNGPYVLIRGKKGEPHKYIFLGDDGEPVREVSGAKSLWFLNSHGASANVKFPFVGKFSSLQSSVVIRHEEGGATYDRLYTADLIPLSPPLPGVRHVHSNIGQRLIGIELDGKKELFWPMLNDGTVPSQPEDLIGIKKLASMRTPSGTEVAWAVKWNTEKGPRWATVWAPNAYLMKNNRALEQVLASKSKAYYRDGKIIFNRVTTYGNTWNRGFVLSRIEGSENYFVFQIGKSDPIEGEVYPTESAARATYKARTKQTLAREEAERQRRWAEQKALMEARKKQEAARKAALAAERSHREHQVHQLKMAGKFNEALAMAREFGSKKVAEVVEYAAKFGRIDNISERDLSVANSVMPRLSRERAKVAALLKQKQNQRWQAQQAQRRQQAPAYRPSYSSPSRSRSYQAPQSYNHKSYSEIMKDMKFKQTIRYIKGQSNWKYD